MDLQEAEVTAVCPEKVIDTQDDGPLHCESFKILQRALSDVVHNSLCRKQDRGGFRHLSDKFSVL